MTKDVAWFFVWKSVISGNSREKWWYRTLHQPNSREKQIIKVLPTENVNYALDSRNVNYIRKCQLYPVW